MSSPSSAPAGSSEQDPGQHRRAVVMGVAGCGKSTLAKALASGLGVPFLEGDDFHSAGNLEKMRAGVALDDADRADWLDDIGRRLAAERRGAVVSCSALKRSYRERLRRAVPGLRLVYLKVGESLAAARVAARGADHVFPARLVASQFAALEEPAAEPDVLVLDGSSPAAALAAQARAWLNNGAAEPGPPGSTRPAQPDAAADGAGEPS